MIHVLSSVISVFEFDEQAKDSSHSTMSAWRVYIMVHASLQAFLASTLTPIDIT